MKLSMSLSLRPLAHRSAGPDAIVGIRGAGLAQVNT